ncbi:MAG: PilZ domain-containing protein [Candidatus Thiodiazotropha sp. (ex Codakia rugifera)]|nr:PilZ domain-containing protein [Candidatus Thiodiazotropha sp. (ex Codakia rugifera)]
MSVERRYSKRFSMRGQAYIRYRKQQVFPARATNLSVQGVFLKTTDLTMLTGAMVELEVFHMDSYWTIMGIVTHTQPNGIGVMFWHPQPAFYESVIQYTFNNQPTDDSWRSMTSDAGTTS